MTTMIRELTANAWFSALPALQISSVWFWLFSGTPTTVIDAGMAILFLIGMVTLGVAVLATFALGVRALIVESAT